MAEDGGIEGLLGEEKEGAEAENEVAGVEAIALTVCLKPAQPAAL